MGTAEACGDVAVETAEGVVVMVTERCRSARVRWYSSRRPRAISPLCLYCPHTHTHTETHTHTHTHTETQITKCTFHTFSLSSARLSVSSCPARSSSLVA